MPPEMPDVVTEEVVASEWGNDIRDRSLQRYATAAERDSLNPTPQRGDLAYVTSADDIEWFDGSRWRALARRRDDPVEQWKTSTLSQALGLAEDAPIDSMVLSIPSEWQGYRVESAFVGDLLDSSGGDLGISMQVKMQCRVDSRTAGPLLRPTAQTEVTDADFQDGSQIQILCVIEGETSTGNKPVYVNMWREDVFTINLRRYGWHVRAVRTA